VREDSPVTTRNSIPPDMLFVNGASSAGKTSLIRAVQDLVQLPYLHVGLDHRPPPMGRRRPGPLRRRGLCLPGLQKLR
jgi:chloramphenicol 3-O phosphotransferase